VTTVTISLSDEQWQKLEELAKQLKLTPEEVLKLNLQKELVKSERNFKHAADYVLAKNAELYRRLA
jgi:predicted transcriptional regulator